MGLAISAIRTAVAEILEGSLGTIKPAAGTFERGAFEGQPDEAKLAKLRQTSTATHWFDVVVGEHENHASSPLSARHGHRRLTALPITVDIYTGVATEAQESERATLLAAAYSDCEDARQALGYPGNLAETVAGLETGIVGGIMRGPAYTGLPDLDRLQEDWGSRWMHSQISGMLVVSEIEDPQSILGSDLFAWYAPDRNRDFATVVNGADTDITTWRNRKRNGDLVQSTSSLRPVLDSDAINSRRAIASDADDTWMLSATLTNTLAASSRPYVWVVAQLEAVGATEVLLTLQGDTAAQALVSVASGNFRATQRSSDVGSAQAVTGPATDTAAHLFEVGWLTTADGRFVVDGVSYDAPSGAGGIHEEYHTLHVGNSSGSAWDGLIAEIVISDVIPTEAQRVAMRAYFERKYAVDVSGVDESGSEDGGILDFSDPNQSGLGPTIGIF